MSSEGDRESSRAAGDVSASLHPSHLAYMRNTPVNTPAYFFGTLSDLNTEAHPDIVRHLFHYSLPECGYDPQARTFVMPEITSENIRDFSERCRRAAEVISEPAVIIGLVTGALADMFRLGDVTSVDETKSRLMRMVEHGVRGELGNLGVMPDEMVGELVDRMEHLPERVVESHETYVYFCENVLRRLLEQPAPI